MNILEMLKQRVRAGLEGWAKPEFAEMLRPTQDPKFGDYQANFCMTLAKEIGANPRQLAQEFLQRVQLDDLCEPPEIAGPGFINLKIRDTLILEQTQAIAHDDRLGVPHSEPKTYIIDFSGPNVAKPMHVGHLRSTVIGDALQRTLRFAGHRVISDNHIGDWGTQFGMIIFGYRNFLNREQYLLDPVAELARLYRLVNRISDYHEGRAELPKLDHQLADQLKLLDTLSGTEPKIEQARKKLGKEIEELRKEIGGLRKKNSAIEEDPELNQSANKFPNIARLARNETAALHAGDQENFKLWQEFIPACLKALQKMYDRLGIRFDCVLGESYFQPRLEKVVQDLLDRGIARESDGAICVFLEGFEAPFIVRKGDGAFTYATTDLATIQYRIQEQQGDVILYVVDSRQADHFQQLFATARRWGFEKTQFHHVSFGSVLGKDKRPYKTREGDAVGLETLLNEAVADARKVIESNPDPEDGLTGELIETVAETVGIGGIKFADLKHNRESDYEYDPVKMLAKTGYTATYLQYAYARIFGIFRRGEVDRSQLRRADPPLLITHSAERTLMLHLLRFPEAIASLIEDFRPNFLTEYLYQLADRFTQFFEQCPVLKAPSEELKKSRLVLLETTAQILQQGLDLLGISVCEKM